MISFKALKAVIAELHGEGVAPTSLLGRFKYFQRMSFPEGSNVGRGARVDYTLSHVLALALAFEMQETAASPVRVVRLLRHQWPDIERAIASSWAALEGLGGEVVLLAHAPGALAEMGMAEDEARPPADALDVMRPVQIVTWLEDRRALGAPSIYLIDLGRFVHQVGRAVISVGGITGEDLRDRFREFGSAAFASDDTRSWVPGHGNVSSDLSSVQKGRERFDRAS